MQLDGTLVTSIATQHISTGKSVHTVALSPLTALVKAADLDRATVGVLGGDLSDTLCQGHWGGGEFYYVVETGELEPFRVVGTLGAQLPFDSRLDSRLDGTYGNAGEHGKDEWRCRTQLEQPCHGDEGDEYGGDRDHVRGVSVG